MLKIRSLESGYGKLRVLKNVSLHVNSGEIVGIIGAILCLLLLGIVGFAYFFGPENIIISPFK